MLYDAWWSYYGEFAVLGIWGIILVLARRMIFGKLSKNALLDGGEKSRMIRAMTLKFEKSYEVHVEISDIPVFVKKYLCQYRSDGSGDVLFPALSGCGLCGQAVGISRCSGYRPDGNSVVRDRQSVGTGGSLPQ